MTKKRVIFRCKWFLLEEQYFDRIKSLQGEPYYRISSPDGVLVLAMTDRNEIILVRQFRPALQQFSLEIPCGHIAKKESAGHAATRELLEETGYVCRTMTPLGIGRFKVNRINCKEFAFFGLGAVRETGFKSKQDIEVVLARPAEFQKMVLSGQFQQWSALAVLLLADWKLGVRLGSDDTNRTGIKFAS